jgi:phage-related minor tail protein
MRTVLSLSALAIAAILPLAGCGEITKVQECNKVIETVNASKIGDSVGNDKKKLEAESKEALDLEKKLAEIKITDEGLKKLMEDYGKNLKDYADMMDKAAKTGESDLDGLMKLVKQASDVATKNSELTGKINSYCSGQSK